MFEFALSYIDKQILFENLFENLDRRYSMGKMKES